LKKAAIARLCLQPDVYRSMPEICVVYLPPPPQSGFFLTATPPSPPDNFRQAFNYNGGPIVLVEGATGKNRLCADYDEPGQKCRVWASSVHHPKKKTAPPLDGKS
jgi:hypothetical protein